MTTLNPPPGPAFLLFLPSIHPPQPLSHTPPPISHPTQPPQGPRSPHKAVPLFLLAVWLVTPQASPAGFRQILRNALFPTQPIKPAEGSNWRLSRPAVRLKPSETACPPSRSSTIVCSLAVMDIADFHRLQFGSFQVSMLKIQPYVLESLGFGQSVY